MCGAQQAACQLAGGWVLPAPRAGSLGAGTAQLEGGALSPQPAELRAGPSFQGQSNA